MKSENQREFAEYVNNVINVLFYQQYAKLKLL